MITSIMPVDAPSQGTDRLARHLNTLLYRPSSGWKDIAGAEHRPKRYAGEEIRTLEGTKPSGPEPDTFDRFATPA